MSIKPVFTISTNLNSNSDQAVPFWVHSPDTKTKKALNYLKKIWKWGKLLFLITFMVLGLWGCFQMTGDPSVKGEQAIGAGLEFGYAYGQTGNFYYDLSSSGYPGYHTFSSFSFNYGPFYALFVYPASVFCLAMMWSMHNMWGGLNAFVTIFVLLIIIRSLTLMITLRSTLQNEKMSEVQGKIAEINGKYKGLTDAISRQRKSQELRAIYAKNNIKPFAPFEQMMITLPIYTIIHRVISNVRPIKATNLFNIWSFASNPLNELFSGHWIYLVFLLIIIPAQALSMFLPRIWAKKRSRSATAISSKGTRQARITNIMQIVILGVMCFVVANSPTGVGLYWFLSSLFSIFQAWLMHVLVLRNRRNHGTLEKKLQALGLE